MRVLLFPDNRSAERVVECLLGWSRSGLIEPFAWRTAEGGAVPDSEAMVSRVDAGEAREMLLGAALQGSARSDNELIAFYPAIPDEGFDAAFAAAAIAHVDLLARTIAHDAARPARCTMVVAPAVIAQPVPPEILTQGFAANVYVAPEDRADPRDTNRLLGNAEVFPLHAAHALATIGDLWDEPGSGREPVLDVLAARQPHNQLAIQVVRCFSRGIDFGYLPDQVSAGIFHGEGGWPNPDPARLDRIDDAERIVPFVVEDFMRAYRQELDLSDFEPQRLDDPREIGLLEAFFLLVRLIWMRIRRRPFELVRERIDSIHDRAADWVERKAGPDSGIRVKHRRGSGGREEDAVELDEALEAPLVVPDGPVAQAWTALRRLVFGLVDGSELPEGIDPTRLVNGRGQRALLTDPRALAPDPDSPPPPVVEDPGPICDPLRLDPNLALLDELTVGDEEEDAARAAAEALAEWGREHRLALLWRVGARIGMALRTAQAEARASLAPSPSEADEEAEAQGAAVEERRGLRRRLRRTLIVASLVALIAASIAAGQLPLLGIAVAVVVIAILWFFTLASAARRWLLADAAISRREDEAKLARLNAALKRSLRMGDAIRLERRYREYLDWAEMLGRLVHRPWVGDPLDCVRLCPPIDHATLPAAFSVAVADVSELGLERLSAAAGSGVFGSGWLAGLYETTERLEMTEIGIRRGLSAEDAEVTRADPAADVGEDREGPRRRMLEAIRRGAHRSLAGSKLGREVLLYLGGLAPDRVCERVAVLPTADGATSGEEIDALPPPLAGFEPPASLSRLVARLAPAVVRIECEGRGREFGGSGVVVGREPLIATALEVVEGASSIAVIGAGGERTAAELRDADHDTGLALLACTGPAVAAQDGGAEDGDEGGPDGAAAVAAASPADVVGDLALEVSEPVAVAQGDPAISIGRPFEGQREPLAAWGLVTAAERRLSFPGAPAGSLFQVAYHRTEGAAGAPVFSLDGELLGIHCAPSSGEVSDLRRQRTSNAIPVAAVRRLIEAGGEATAASEPAPAGRMNGGERALMAPSVFIGELTNVDPPPALLTHHWKDAQKKNDTSETIPAAGEAVTGSDDFSALVGELAFLAPMRVLVHRVDLVAPSGVRDLTSFPDEEDEEPDTEEPIGPTNM